MSETKILGDYLDEPALAKELGRSTRTIARWRAKRKGPAPTFIGRAPVYRIDAVRNWLKAKEQPMPRARTRNLALPGRRREWSS